MTEGYRRLQLSQGIFDDALARASKLPVFENSHREEQANLVGCLGEVAFETFLKHHGVPFENHTASTRHDYIINNRTRVDVKTKDRTVMPKGNYDNSVPLYNHEHQRPDFYYFISLYRDPAADVENPYRFKTACLLGGISLERLEKVGQRWDAGQTDERNGTTFWTACLNVEMGELLPNSEFLELIR